MAKTATSEVDICNLALDHLKQDEITSIEVPENNRAEVCARWYHVTRRATLRKHVWNFGTKRTTLAKLTEAPAFGFSSQYKLPDNYIRLASLGSDSITPFPHRDFRTLYDIEDGKILVNETFNETDSTALPIRYVYDITNVSQFDPLFVVILSLEIALNIAYKFVGSDTTVNRVLKRLELEAPVGYAIDGQDRPTRRIQNSRSNRSRRSNQRTNNYYYVE